MNKELLRFIDNQLCGIRSAIASEAERYEMLPIADAEKVKMLRQVTAKLIECGTLIDKANRNK